MQPERVKFSGIEYDVIGSIKLNNGQYLFLKNNDEIISIDMNNINSSYFGIEAKKGTKVEDVLIEYITEKIRDDIRSGKYQDKESLKSDIKDLNKYIQNHNSLLSNIKQLDFKDEIVNKTITNLLAYFDEEFANAPLNLEDINEFKVNGKNYIKYKDENNKIKILDNNVDNRNFVEQFKTKQNESKNFNLEDGKESSLNIAKDMEKFQKKSIELESIDELVNNEDSNKLSNLTMQKYDENKSMVGNTETGIYYNPNEDQILTTTKEDNKMVINEINKVTAKESENSANNQAFVMHYPEYNEDIVTQYLIVNKSKNIDNFISYYLNSFSLEQIDYILDNYSLTQKQQHMLNEQKNLKSELKTEQIQKQNEKPKTKVLIFNSQKEPNAAFVDTLLLSFIVGLVSGIYLFLLILIILS